MSGFAWVTLATNDSYSLGALVLAHSLKQAGTAHQLAVLVTPGVTNGMRQNLADAFNVVEEVNLFDSKDEANLRLLKRPELGVTFTKLHCWRLTQFEKCVFLDADVLVLANSDELFERDEFSAAPDVGWPDCFNSGVFVYKPSMETYNKLVDFALQKGSFDGGDQGLLNAYFSDWAHKDISKHLPFIYNMCSTACYSYLPAFKYYGGNVKIVHFIGPAKPWLQYFDTESRVVHPSPDLQHLQEVLQRWWDIFCSLIHPKLTPDMAPSKQAAENLSHFQSHSYTHQNPVFQDLSNSDISTQIGQETNAYSVWDPWEEYEEKLNSENVPEVPAYNECPSPEAGHCDISHLNQINVQENGYVFENNQEQALFNGNVEQHEHVETENCSDNHQPHIASIVDNNLDSIEFIPEITNTNPPQNLIQIPHSLPHTQSLTESLPNLCETSANNSQDASLHTKDIDDGADSASQSGLAGAFAQFTLGVKRSAAQDALENHLRRQAWEVGNIDYMGRDSFDNIWSKICQTLSTTQLESVKDGEVPQESSTAAPAQPILEQAQTEPPKSTIPQEAVPQTDVKVQEEQAAKPDVVPDPEPRKEDAQPIAQQEGLPAEPAVSAEIKAEIPAELPKEVLPEPEPPKLEGEPPKSEAEPPKSEAEPPKSEAEAPKLEAEPPKSEPALVTEVLPSESQTEPPKSEAEPPKSEVEPPKSEAEPPKSEAEPPKSESAAIKEVLPSESQSEPPKSEPEPPKSEPEPPKSEPEPLKSEAEPPKSEPAPLKEVIPSESQPEPVQEVVPPKSEPEPPKPEPEPPKSEPEPPKSEPEPLKSEPEPPKSEPEPPKSEPEPPKSEPEPPKSEPAPVKEVIPPESQPEPVQEVVPPKSEPELPPAEPKPVQEIVPPKSEPEPIKQVLPPEQPAKEVAPPDDAKPKPTKREAKAPKSPDSSKIAKTPKVETTIESPKAEAAPESPKTEVPPVPGSPKAEDAPTAEASAADVPKSDTKPKEVRKVKKKVKKVPKPEGDASEGAPKK